MIPFGKQQEILERCFDDKSRGVAGKPRRCSFKTGIIYRLESRRASSGEKLHRALGN
jgi:hypothetical protein